MMMDARATWCPLSLLPALTSIALSAGQASAPAVQDQKPQVVAETPFRATTEQTGHQSQASHQRTFW